MNLILLGVTGDNGLSLLDQALEHGYNVIAIAHTHSNLQVMQDDVSVFLMDSVVQTSQG